MNFKYLLVAFFLLLYITAVGQYNKYDPLRPPNTFQNADNPYYWKNKMPKPGYWQQDVHYEIKAEISAETDIVTGEEVLTYWNNSDDTLSFVFFHLYQNAFQPESYYDKLHETNKIEPQWGQYEKDKKGTTIESITDNQPYELALDFELDNTIMKVQLKKPVPPGGKTQFKIAFKTHFSGDAGARRRMKTFRHSGVKHYDGVHWYPRISVYDSKFGWITDQHLGREFYADFGCYEVELTFPSNYVVDATGFLQNRAEVLPDDLRAKLDIKNFANKPWNEAPSIITPYNPNEKKTWKFHAENVHNFAWTADPTYRIGEAEWNGVNCVALVQEPHARGWVTAAEFTAQIIEVYSKRVGMYGYHKMIVADARDGMEYPMLTLNNGSNPGYRGLLAHEVGHNWFYGMVGNNETYRAALDEGFTQFIESWALEDIDGKYMKTGISRSAFIRKYRQKRLVMDRVVYDGYMRDAVRNEDAALNTHSDQFNGKIRHGGGYRHVYYKTAAMLHNLEYVLGEELFAEAFKNYFDEWKFAHPYFDDFRHSIINYTKVDLNWFFDQWLETTKTIDYGVKSIKPASGTDNYKIKIARYGAMQMPIDFTVKSKLGNSHKFYIPNNWFEKQTDAKILDRWIGWDNLQPTYTAIVNIPGGISNVIIDPTNRLADMNMLNNSKVTPVSTKLDANLRSTPSWKKYQVKWRPDVWHNAYDGVKAGLHFNGNYMRHRHQFSASAWLNTGIAQNNLFDYGIPDNEEDAFDKFSFNLSYKNSIHKLIPRTFLNIKARHLDGLDMAEVGITKTELAGNKYKGVTVDVSVKTMFRDRSEDYNYLLNPNQWGTEKNNTSLNLSLAYPYKYVNGTGNIKLGLRSTTLFSDYDYNMANVEVINTKKIKKLDLKTRTFIQFGTGNNAPLESSLYLAGANPEELMENKYTRSRAFVPDNWVGYGTTSNHFHHGGGLNLRGYAGYLAIHEDDDGFTYLLHNGNSGASINAELDFDKLFSVRSRKPVLRSLHFDLYAFGDAGLMMYENVNDKYRLSDIRMDAGLGAAMTIRRFWKFETVKPLTLRFDAPLYVSHAPFAEPDNFKFRWVVGINRAF